MTTGTLQPVTSAQPIDGDRPSDASRPNRHRSIATTSFDALLAGLTAFHDVGVKLSTLRPPAVTQIPTRVDDDRARRLFTMRQVDAENRAAGGSRVAGATHAAAREVAADDIVRQTRQDATGRDTPVDDAAGKRRATGRDPSSAPLRSDSNDARSYSNRTPGTNARESTARNAAALDSTRHTGSQTVGHDGSGRTNSNALPEATHAPRIADAAPPVTPRAAKSVQDSLKETTPVATSRSGASGTTRPAAQPSTQSPPQTAVKEARGDLKDPLLKTTDPKKAASTDSSKSRLIEGMARVIRAQFGRRETIARIRLDPPSLGQVRINLRLKGDTVQIRLATETTQARQTLLSNVEELRSALEQQGLQVRRIDFPAATQVEHGSTETSASDSNHGSRSQTNVSDYQEPDAPANEARHPPSGVHEERTTDAREEVGWVETHPTVIEDTRLDVRI